jgi:hypothetical protein
VSGPRVLRAGATTSADATSIDVVGVVLVVLASALLTLGTLQSGSWAGPMGEHWEPLAWPP